MCGLLLFSTTTTTTSSSRAICCSSPLLLLLLLLLLHVLVSAAAAADHDLRLSDTTLESRKRFPQTLPALGLFFTTIPKGQLGA